MLLMHANNRERNQGSLRRRHHRAGGLKEPPPATRCAIRRTRSSSSAWTFPEPVIEIASSRSRRPTRRRWASRWLVSLPKTRPSASRPISSRARPSSRAWANFTSTSRSTSHAREYKVEANIGAPQVAYRETSRAQGRDRLHPQEADRRYGPVRPRQARSSRPSRAGYSFENKIVGGAVPKEYIPGVEKGLKSVMETACSPASRSSTSRSTLIDGAYHDVDSSCWPSKSRPRGVARRSEEGRRQAARADHEGRGGDAGRLRRRRHRRPELAAAARSRAGQPRQRQRHQRDGAAGQHVRLRQQPALDVPGPRQPTRCSSTTTSRCRRTSPTKSRRNTPDRCG
jgi:elongation factor G